MILKVFPSKVCFKCGQEKFLDDFYKHPQMGDGYLGKCKECAKNDANKHRKENIERIRAYDRKRGKLPYRIKLRQQLAKEHPEWHKRGMEKYFEKYPERRAATSAVGNAIRDGRLVRKPCEVCGELLVEAHHDDYLKPLDVRWLCLKHHKEADKIRQQREKESPIIGQEKHAP